MPSPSESAYETAWLTPSTDQSKQLWATLHRQGTGSTPYNHPAFAEAYFEVLGIPYRMAVTVDREGQARAGALVFEKRRGPYREAVTPRMVQYVPALTLPFPSEADIHCRNSSLDSLASFLEHQLHVCRIVFPPEVTDLRTFIWRKWRVTPYYTYRIALSPDSPPEATWSSGSARLLKRESANYVIESSLEGIDATVALNTVTYNKKRIRPPYDENRIVRLARALADAGLATAFTLRRHAAELPEAGVVVLQEGGTAYYWLAASRRGPAMTVLLGLMLPELALRGVKLFDFVGANTPSIAEFKRRFGPQLLPYFRAEYIGRPELRLIHAARSLF